MKEYRPTIVGTAMDLDRFNDAFGRLSRDLSTRRDTVLREIQSFYLFRTEDARTYARVDLPYDE